MNSEYLKVIWLVNRGDDDPCAFSKTKELMADHFNIKVFKIKQFKFASDVLWLLELL